MRITFHSSLWASASASEAAGPAPSLCPKRVRCLSRSIRLQAQAVSGTEARTDGPQSSKLPSVGEQEVVPLLARRRRASVVQPSEVRSVRPTSGIDTERLLRGDKPLASLKRRSAAASVTASQADADNAAAPVARAVAGPAGPVQRVRKRLAQVDGSYVAEREQVRGGHDSGEGTAAGVSSGFQAVGGPRMARRVNTNVPSDSGSKGYVKDAEAQREGSVKPRMGLMADPAGRPRALRHASEAASNPGGEALDEERDSSRLADRRATHSAASSSAGYAGQRRAPADAVRGGRGTGVAGRQAPRRPDAGAAPHTDRWGSPERARRFQTQADPDAERRENSERGRGESAQPRRQERESGGDGRRAQSAQPDGRRPYAGKTRRTYTEPGTGGRGGGQNGRKAESGTIWDRYAVPRKFNEELPTLSGFAEEVANKAAGWHPVIMCAAFNHAAMFHDELSRRHADPEEHATLERVLDTLQAVFAPNISTIPRSRYAVNALWVCAKTNHWGDPAFAAAIVDRLRGGGSYELLRDAVGQAHGNLWWALSQPAAPAKSDDSSRTDMDQELAPGLGVEGEGEGPVAGPAAEAMDVLAASARLIKAKAQLDEQTYKPQELANMVLGAARLGYNEDPEFVEHLLRHLLRHPGPFKPQAISNVVYALGLLHSQATADSGRPVYGESDRLPKQVVLVAPPAAYQAGLRGLAALALRLGLHAFKAQELSNMLIGCTRLGVELPGPWALPQGQDRGHGPGGVAGGGGRGDEAGAFVEMLGAHIKLRLMNSPVFGTQALANATWALARMGCSDQAYYAEAVRAALAGGFRGAKPQEWSNIMWALAVVRHRPPPALVRLLVSSQSGRTAAWARDQQAWTNALWSAAVLDLYDEGLLDFIDEVARACGCANVTPHGLVNCLWALACMGPGSLAAHAGLAEVMLAQLERRQGEGVDLIGKVQLWQVHLELEAAAGEPAGAITPQRRTLRPGAKPRAAAAAAASPPLRLSPALLALAREGIAGVNADVSDRVATGLHMDVYGCVVFLMAQGRRAARAGTPQQRGPGQGQGQGQEVAEEGGASRRRRRAAAGPAAVRILRVEQEWLVEEVMMRVDVCVWLSDGRVVAVEADGPSHYLCNEPDTPLPRTLLRNRQLERVLGAGNVVSVPYRQWGDFESQEAKRTFMVRALGLGL